ncbi:MAG: hypothetical protein ACK2T7_15365 [Anaerolineales bacterium]
MILTQPKLITMGILFVVIFIFGYMLSGQGKPYGVLLFNAHKLLALGTMVYLGIMIYRRHQVEPLDSGQLAWIIATAAIAMVTIVIGGLQDTDLNLPAALKFTHKVFPYLTVISTAASVYFVFLS